MQGRIDELTAQKAHFQQKAQKYEAEQARQREEIAELKGRLAAAPAPAAPKGSPKTWQDMSDDQLDEAKRYARTNDQPDVIDAIYEEKARRAADHARKEAVEESTRRSTRAQLLRDVHTQILDEFGPTALTETESPLYQGAVRYLDQKRRLYGDEVAGTPHALLEAFVAADRDTRVKSERLQLTQLQQENQALKDRASLAERGNLAATNARAVPDEVKEALKRGDRRAAIKGMATFRDLTDTAQRNLLPRK